MEIVPFEIARKLKEKGFKEKCLTYYDVEDNVGLLYNTQYSNCMLPCQYTDLLQSHNTGEAEKRPDDSEYCVDAPTISQVLKWLREKKIHISPCCYKDDEPRFAGWYYLIIDMRNKIWKYYNQDYRRDNTSATYESAAIDAIEFCLDKLI